MRRKRRRLRFAGKIIEAVLFFGCITAVIIGAMQNASTKTAKTIPEIVISLADGLSLDEIHQNSKTIKYYGNDLAVKDGETELSFNNVEIKGRGNITWHEQKRPYRIKFVSKVDFLGMGRLRKWAFLTYSLDDSLLRGDLGFYFARLINPNYPLIGEFAKLSINEQDLGLYYITPTVTIAKNVIDLRSPTGILVELDNAYYGEAEYRCVLSSGDHLAVKDAVDDDAAETVFLSFCSDFDKAEKAIKDGDYVSASKIFDMRSLAEYVLFSEFIGNTDAYVTSFYFYRDGDQDLIHAGPAWDFDAAFGNLRSCSDGCNETFVSPQTLMARRRDFLRRIGVSSGKSTENLLKIATSEDVSTDSLNRIYSVLAYDLLVIPEFNDLMRQIYTEQLAGRRAEVSEYIKEKAAYIRDAAILNNALWGNGDFDEAVSYLIWWIEQRFDVFDKMYGVKNGASVESLL